MNFFKPITKFFTFTKKSKKKVSSKSRKNARTTTRTRTRTRTRTNNKLATVKKEKKPSEVDREIIAFLKHQRDPKKLSRITRNRKKGKKYD